MNKIKEYWDSQAKLYKNSIEASWGDQFAIALEVDEIGKYIKEGMTVLDVGCANGHATMIHQQHNPEKIVGVDYSEFMIDEAKRLETEILEFQVANILDLPFEDNSFDLVYTTRCLINLPTWEDQKRGINECLRVAKKKVLFSEGFWEPLQKLNALRLLVGLDPLVEHDFNRYLKGSELNSYLNIRHLKYLINRFSSVYYLGSRFLRELVTDISEYEGYSNPINEIFYELEGKYSGGDFGIQQLYVIAL